MLTLYAPHLEGFGFESWALTSVCNSFVMLGGLQCTSQLVLHIYNFNRCVHVNAGNSSIGNAVHEF